MKPRLLVALLGLGLGVTCAFSAPAPETPPPGVLRTFDPVLARARRSLVQVAGMRSHASLRSDASGSRRAGTSLASGVILDERGHIVTIASAVEGCDRVSVFLSDGREVPAILLGSDAASDVALLQVVASGLHGLKLAADVSGPVGSWVLTLGQAPDSHPGHSFGLLHHRYDQPLASLFLLTNRVYPGYSGGAALNARGELIGLIVGALDRVPEDWPEAGDLRSGASFALTADDLRSVVGELLQYGRVRRGFLGVRMAQGEVEDTNRPGEPFKIGVRVQEIVVGSPAERAGLRVGDLIVGWNGEQLESPEDLMRRVESSPPGTTADLVWVRDEIRHDGRLVVSARPEDLLAEGDHPTGPAEGVGGAVARPPVSGPASREVLARRIEALRILRAGQAPADSGHPAPESPRPPGIPDPR